MKLCVLSTSYPRSPGDDAGIFVKRLLEEMAGRGHSLTVIVPHDGPEPERERDGSIEVERVRYWPGSRKLAFGSGILPNLRRRPYLAVQLPLLILGMALRAFRMRKRTDLLFANWLLAALSVWVVSLLCGKPYAVTLRGEDVRFIRSRFTRYFFIPCLRRASVIVTVSDEFKRLVMRILPELHGRVHWIPNGVSLPVFPASGPLSSVPARMRKGTVNIIYVGRLIRLKRIEVLIAVLSLLPEDWRLVVCGHSADSDYRRFLEQTAKERGVEERVAFTGRIAPAEVSGYLAAARFYASASSYEGRSNSIIEAMASGLVTAASDIPGHREVMTQGVTGVLFNPDELPALRDELMRIHSEPELYASISERSKAYAAQFSWSNCAGHYLDLFENSVINADG